MNLEQTIKDALILQDKLNKVIDPNWKQNRNLIDWIIAINQEFAELMDSLDWAWWKKSNLNLDNVKIEFVDIFHFLLSWTLQYGKNKNIDYLAFIVSLSFDNDSSGIPLSTRDLMRVYRDFIFATSIAEENNSDSLVGVYVTLVWKPFVRMVKVFMSEKELFKMYFFKNALNKLRKDFGYKKDKYQKNWNGKEDNEVMLDILKEVDDIDFETAYNLLKEKYLKVVNY